jgi:DNA-binding transcriptional LysR family regulator
MENFRLKVFRTVAEKQSFRQAAEALYLTQPAVTMQVKALEDDVGLQLFDRSCKTIQLTDAGVRLLQYAQKISALSSAARHDLALLKGPDSAELKIGVTTTIAQYFIFKVLSEFRESNPQVELRVLSGNTEAAVDDLIDGKTSLALIEAPAHPPLLKTEPFVPDEIVVIVAANHPWRKQTVAVDQLAQAPLIFREEGTATRRVVEAGLKNRGVRLKDLRVVMELNSTEAVKAAVEAGIGVGFVSRRAIEKEIELGTLSAVQLDRLRFRREFSILYARGPELSGVSGLFLAFLRQIRERAGSERFDKKSSSRIRTTDVAFA